MQGFSIPRVLLGLATAAMVVLLAVIGVLAAVDSGRFNSQIAGFAASRLHRTVTFSTLRVRLLSTRPTVTFRDLILGSPAWAGSTNLLEADQLSLTFRWPDLAITDVNVDHPRLNLVRITPEQTNWSQGESRGKGDDGGGVPDSLRSVRLADGEFTFEDKVGDLHLSGTASYDAVRSAAFPVTLAAHGALKGGKVLLSARGGPLIRRPHKAPYPFSARIQDGATFLDAQGVSEKPAQLSGFDLTVVANGPNLADMKYLIGLGLPNSAPYRLSAKLSRRGPTTRATDLKAVIGQSDFVGSIVSDGSGARRLITIKLQSQTLYAADVGTLLGHIPAHALTRSVSGAASNGKPKGPMLSTAPIDLKRFRQKDARLEIAARRFVIGGLSPGRLNTVGTLNHGQLELRPFRIDFPSGRADGTLQMDLNGPNPAFRLEGSVRKSALGALVPALAKTATGMLDATVDVAGSGPSWRAIGLNANGQLDLSLRDGEIQSSKADVISGAVVQGAFTALANKTARTALSCAVAQIAIGRGRIAARKMLLVTDAGTAVADGGIDLNSETLDLTIYGRPSRLRLFAVNAPVSISGPMLHPQAQVRLPGLSSAPPRAALVAPKIEGDRTVYCRQQLAGAP